MGSCVQTGLTIRDTNPRTRVERDPDRRRQKYYSPSKPPLTPPSRRTRRGRGRRERSGGESRGNRRDGSPIFTSRPETFPYTRTDPGVSQHGSPSPGPRGPSEIYISETFGLGRTWTGSEVRGTGTGPTRTPRRDPDCVRRIDRPSTPRGFPVFHFRTHPDHPVPVEVQGRDRGRKGKDKDPGWTHGGRQGTV